MDIMKLSATERDNIIKWQGENGFYEVYYIKFNHLSTHTACWIRYTLLSPVRGESVAELWAIFFDSKNPSENLAFKESHPVAEAEYSKERFYFRIKDAVISHDSARGRIKKGDNFIIWDLHYEPNLKTFYHYPNAYMYKFKLPRTKVLSPNFTIKINGMVEVNGRKLLCNNEPGQQTHIWGTKHAERWVWANCNSFSNQEGIFEGLSGEIRVGKFLTPPLTPLYVCYQGREYYMNGLLRAYKNFSLTQLPSWKFTGISGEYSFEGEAWADIENFVGVAYTDPDGEKLWCYNTKVANMKINVYMGARQVDELKADGTAALEFVSRERDGRIPILI